LLVNSYFPKGSEGAKEARQAKPCEVNVKYIEYMRTTAAPSTSTSCPWSSRHLEVGTLVLSSISKRWHHVPHGGLGMTLPSSRGSSSSACPSFYNAETPLCS
jgi:hypothetical protein